MKKVFVVLSFILSTVFTLGQDLSISVSPTLSNLFHYQFVAGGPIKSAKVGFSSSFHYEFINEKKVSFGMGVGYQYSQVELAPSAGLEGDPHTETGSLISASFNMIYNFRHQYYLSLAPLIDFQPNNDSPDAIENQTGLGLSFAAGKKIVIKDSFYVRIEPRIWIHNIIPLNDEYQPAKLTVIGVNLGVGIRK